MTDISPVFCKCGSECIQMPSEVAVIDANADVADYDTVRTNKPKWLRFKDGHRERFDATKHGYKKGAGGVKSKKK